MINGDASTFLKALGAREGDERLAQAIAVVGGTYSVEEYNDDGVEEKYLDMSDRGVELLLQDGELETVFVFATVTDEHVAYGGWTSLIDGVSVDSSRDDITRAMGEPLRSTSKYVTYDAEPGFVQFEFDDDRLSMAVFMRRLIGGASPVETPVAVTGAGTVEGQAATFISAVGADMFSAEHMSIIVLAGPAIESRDDMRDGVAWQYDHFPNTGVTIQFKGEELVGALIPLQPEDGRSAYPTPELLVTGLSLPASREAIAAHFGAPQRSSQHMDLYLVDDRYLRFDFEDGQSTALTVALPGATI